MSIRPLPPLNTLQAFEASARLLSFTAAAQELSISQGAISQQIRRLEETLGKPLFLRGKQGISLTPSGQRYYGVIQNALKQIATETSEIMKWSGEHQITVACSLTVANYWLVPRLSELQIQHPELQIRLLTVEDYTNLEPSEFDVALYYCLHPPSMMEAVPIFPHEDVVAICSPGYLEAHADKPIQSAKDLLEHTLLVMEEHHNDWFTWEDWFHELGLPNHKPESQMYANNYSLLMNATMAGHGIALGWKQLFQQYLNNGSLVTALDTAINSQGQLNLLQPQYRHPSPAVLTFCQWLKNLATQDNSSSAPTRAN